jgi:hypothetical protein
VFLLFIVCRIFLFLNMKMGNGKLERMEENTMPKKILTQELEGTR